MPPIYPKQLAYADSFGQATLAVVSALPGPEQPGSAVFSSACFKHCVTLSADFWTVQSEGISLSTAIRWWFFGGCPPQDCPDGLPQQVIEHCDEGFEECKHKCDIRRARRAAALSSDQPSAADARCGTATREAR
jgi:hypothetical protein